jgi:hypothetical protein
VRQSQNLSFPLREPPPPRPRPPSATSALGHKPAPRPRARPSAARLPPGHRARPFGHAPRPRACPRPQRPPLGHAPQQYACPGTKLAPRSRPSVVRLPPATTPAPSATPFGRTPLPRPRRPPRPGRSVCRRRTALAVRTSVTLASLVPDHKAWMSLSRSYNDMAGTSTPYPRSRTGQKPAIIGHGNVPGTQEHQKSRLGPCNARPRSQTATTQRPPTATMQRPATESNSHHATPGYSDHATPAHGHQPPHNARLPATSQRPPTRVTATTHHEPRQRGESAETPGVGGRPVPHV